MRNDRAHECGRPVPIKVPLTGDVSAAHVVGWDVFIYGPGVWLFEPAPWAIVSATCCAGARKWDTTNESFHVFGCGYKPCCFVRSQNI